MKKNIYSIILLGTTTLLVGGMSYLYQLIMIKYLDTRSFADFASLVSIINLLAVITTGFALFLVKEFTKSPNKEIQKIIIRTTLIYGGLFGI